MWIWFFFFAFSLLAKPLEVEIASKSGALINLDTGAILFEQEGEVKRHPASLTKIATALYLLEEGHFSPGEKVRISKEAVRWKKGHATDKSHYLEANAVDLKLKVGEHHPFELLLEAMLIYSANDVANALAASKAPIEETLSQMNRYLTSIGCTSTHFTNPHGLTDENHYTTALDLCRMTRKALSFPLFRQVVSKNGMTWPSNPPRLLPQTNRLMRPGPFYYPKAFGVKTGYTEKALYTLVAAAENGERRLVVALLEAPTKEARYEDAIRLFEAAFREKRVKKVIVPHNFFAARDVAGGEKKVKGVLKKEIAIEYYPSEEEAKKAHIVWRSLLAPIEKGEIVGTVEISTPGGKVLIQEPLFASERVSPTVWQWVKNLF